MEYPSEKEAYEILERYVIPRKVMDHSIEVKYNSRAIGIQLLRFGNEIDLDLIEVGGLLHDLGRSKYSIEKGYSYDQDFHEYETGKILTELGYKEFGEMLRCHPLGGLTKEETKLLGFPEAVDLIPTNLEIKVICIADKIRFWNGIDTLPQKINDLKTNKRLQQRYFDKVPGLLEDTIERVTTLWEELVSLGMKNPPMKR